MTKTVNRRQRLQVKVMMRQLEAHQLVEVSEPVPPFANTRPELSLALAGNSSSWSSRLFLDSSRESSSPMGRG